LIPHRVLPLDTLDGDEITRGDAASRFVVNSGDSQTQELFYRTFVMQNEFSELAFLAEYGLVQHIEGVQALLQKWDDPRQTEEILPGRVKWYTPDGIQFGR